MKRFLSLLLVFALLCSAMLFLAACDTPPDDKPDDNPSDEPGDEPGDEPEAPKGTIGIVTDPTDPEAGGDSDENYIRQ